MVKSQVCHAEGPGLHTHTQTHRPGDSARGAISHGCSSYHTNMAKGLGHLVHVLSGCWEEVAEVFIRSSWQATLPQFPQRKKSFQIRNSLKWNLTKKSCRGEALIQRHLASPLYEAATHVKIDAIPAQCYYYHHVTFPRPLIYNGLNEAYMHGLIGSPLVHVVHGLSSVGSKPNVA